MKILMTALQPSGGIKTFFRYVYGQTIFSDSQFILVAPDEGLSDFFSDCLPSGRITVIPTSRDKVEFIKTVRREIRSTQADFVHSHGFSAGLLTEVARLGIGCPHLMTAHDVFTSAQFVGWKGKLKWFGMSRLFNRIDLIHTVTSDARDNFLEYFPSVKASCVRGILHGVDTNFFREGDKRDIKGEIGLSSGTPLLGFFGRFMGQKGFRVLVDAIDNIVKNRKFDPVPHVVTFGWGGYVREDYEYLKNKGLADFFHQCPQTDNMPAALKGVDVVVMPSRWEACGLLAMEALSAGVPIIGTDCIGLREVIENTPAQMVKAGESVDLANAIVRDLCKLDSRKSEFLEFQSESVKRFCIERPSTALHELYIELSMGS